MREPSIPPVLAVLFGVVIVVLVALEGLASAEDPPETTTTTEAPTTTTTEAPSTTTTEAPSTTTTSTAPVVPPGDEDGTGLLMLIRLGSFGLGAGTCYVVIADRW